MLNLIVIIFLFISTTKSQEQIDELDKLIEVLKKSGDSARVGFLSNSNYISVKKILPQNVKPVIVDGEELLTLMVINGSLNAALVSGMPHKYQDQLHIFSSTIVTLHAILMAPDWSIDLPQGLNGSLSTKHLGIAINAAITRIQSSGIDDQLAIKNAPKEIVHAYTCKDDSRTQFPLPNKKDAEGLLKDILDNKKFKVLAMGPYNWGDNDGNYLVTPPIGFYPDYLTAIADQFKNMSGPDNVTYGDIQIERVYTKDPVFPWYKLFDGSTHFAEPYFILDSAYAGSGKPCQKDDDCLNADLPSGKETCKDGFCTIPMRTRISMFRTSCTTVGSDSKFYTKRYSQKPDTGKTTLDGGIIALIVILAIVCFLAISFIGLLFCRRVLDRSSFQRLLPK